MKRPHESPDCKCAGCVEWDTPSPFVEAMSREIEGAMDTYAKRFELFRLRDAGICIDGEQIKRRDPEQ